MAPDQSQVATVQGLTIDRDAGHFLLSDGTLTLLTPVGNQTVAAVFRGHGTFTFTAPSQLEKDRLIRFEKRDSLSDSFTEMMLLFSDTTLAELKTRLKFGPGTDNVNAKGTIRDMFKFLSDENHKSFDPDMMGELLNGDHEGLFYAFLNRENRSPVMFVVDPEEAEGIQLQSRIATGFYTHDNEILTRFPARNFVPDTLDPGERVGQPQVKAYRMEAWMPQSGGAGLAFSASAHLDIAASRIRGPWIPFNLFYKLDIDSVQVDGGGAIPFFKGHDDPLVWLKLPAPLEPGKTASVTLYYHGALFDRIGDFFFMKAPSEWYPLSLEGRAYATFDMTYHSPDWLQFASVGTRVDSSDANRMATTRWQTDGPIRNATFNLGLFEAFHSTEPGVPPVTLLVSEQAHKMFSGMLIKQKNMKEVVGADLTGALKFFNYAYGPLPFKQITATEIPYGVGLAFPGMLDLSWVTFQQTNDLGEDQIFRAHEVAHQWWGVGMDFTTYHDQWLSEGFANFSGLWYLQVALKDNNKYFGALDRWRANIVLHRDERSPIYLGYRAQNSRDSTGYDILIYQKGAWVLHMLRDLMIDLKTMNEDRFTGLMRQFYADHAGRRASTADFERAVEQTAGQPMDWFFNQWVYGYQIPTYKVATQTEKADGQYKVHLKVVQEDVPESFLMYVPVAVDLGDKKIARFRVKVTGHESKIDLPPLPLEPKSVKFNDLDGVLADVKTVSW